MSDSLTVVVLVVVVVKAMGQSSTILGLHLLGLVLAARKYRDGATKSRIGVCYHYHSFQFVKSVNNTLSQDIKEAAK